MHALFALHVGYAIAFVGGRPGGKVMHWFGQVCVESKKVVPGHTGVAHELPVHTLSVGHAHLPALHEAVVSCVHVADAQVIGQVESHSASCIESPAFAVAQSSMHA